MSTNTPNLNLKKINTATDGNNTFNIDTDLNDNWDKIDLKVKQIEDAAAGITFPVTKVNNKTGDVVLSASDIKAADGTTLEAFKTSTVSTLAERLTKTEIRNGPLEIGQWIDFHKSGSGTDFDGRITMADDSSYIAYNSSTGIGGKILTQTDYATLQAAINGCFKPSNYGKPIYFAGNSWVDVQWSNFVVYGGGVIVVPLNVCAIGTQITFINWEINVFTFMPLSNEVVIVSKDSKRTIDGMGASATLIYIGNNYWSLVGALK